MLTTEVSPIETGKIEKLFCNLTQCLKCLDLALYFAILCRNNIDVPLVGGVETGVVAK